MKEHTAHNIFMRFVGAVILLGMGVGLMYLENHLPAGDLVENLPDNGLQGDYGPMLHLVGSAFLHMGGAIMFLWVLDRFSSQPVSDIVRAAIIVGFAWAGV